MVWMGPGLRWEDENGTRRVMSTASMPTIFSACGELSERPGLLGVEAIPRAPNRRRSRRLAHPAAETVAPGVEAVRLARVATLNPVVCVEG
jgi:hypothetical protein